MRATFCLLARLWKAVTVALSNMPRAVNTRLLPMPAPEWVNLKVGYAASDSAACSGNTTAASQPAERPESARQALLLISSEPGSTVIVEAKLAPESESRQWEHTEMLLIIERAMQHTAMMASSRTRRSPAQRPAACRTTPRIRPAGARHPSTASPHRRAHRPSSCRPPLGPRLVCRAIPPTHFSRRGGKRNSLSATMTTTPSKNSIAKCSPAREHLRAQLVQRQLCASVVRLRQSHRPLDSDRLQLEPRA